MAAPVLDAPRNTRIRASKKAIETALEALAAKGLAVEKLCVIGGQVDIIVGTVEGRLDGSNDGGLKQL